MAKLTIKETLQDHRHVACRLVEVYEEQRWKDKFGYNLAIMEEVIKLARAVENSDERSRLRRGMAEVLKLRQDK